MALYTTVATITQDVCTTIADLKARFTSSNFPATSYCYTTIENGVQASWQYNPSSIASNDDVLIVVSSGGHRFERVIEGNKAYLSWFQSTDYSSVISKLIDGGYKIEGNWGAVYPCTTLIFKTDKSVYLNGNGCNFELTNSTENNYWIKVEMTPETVYDVTSISSLASSATVEGNTDLQNTTLGGTHGTSYITLAGDQTANFKAGDAIRLYSVGEYVPGMSTSPGDGNFRAMKGEFITPELVVYDNTNNLTRLVIQRTTSHTYNVTTSPYNTKVARMKKHTVKLENFTYDYKSRGTLGTIRVEGAYCPTFKNIITKNNFLTAISLKATYCALVEGVQVLNAQNGPAYGFAQNATYGQAGYGVACAQDFGTRVSNCVFVNCRHGFTTGANDQIVGTTTYAYDIGETYDCIVSDNVARGCVHAFDTHNVGFNITFNGNIIDSCAYGYQIRSRSTSVYGGRIFRTMQPVYAKVFTSGLADNPMIFDGLNIDESYYVSSPTAIKVNHDFNYKTIIRNSFIRGGMIEIDVADFEMYNCRIETTLQNGGTESAEFLNLGTACSARVENCYIKSSKNGFVGVNLTGANCDVVLNNCTFETPGDSTPLLFSTAQTGQKCTAIDCKFIGANGPNITSTTVAVNGTLTNWTSLKLGYKHLTLDGTASNKNSCLTAIGGTGSVSITSIQYLLDDHIVVKITSGGNATLASLPTTMPYEGQKVTFVNTTNTTFTAPTLNSVSKSLTQYQSATALYVTSGVWVWL
jgi:hypothetical protein